MRLFTLYTGGKDSTTATLLALKDGFDVESLLVIKPRNIESYMFHTVNIDWTYLQAISMDMKIYFFQSSGIKELELDDLKRALKIMCRMGYDGVVSGAVASRYQYDRIKNLADEVGLKTYTPLWGLDQDYLLRLYLKLGVKYMIVSVSALGLEPIHLGWVIESKKDVEDLISLACKYNFNPTGEGGEYESYVIDAPNFRYLIYITEYDIKWYGDSGCLYIRDAKLVEKVV